MSEYIKLIAGQPGDECTYQQAPMSECGLYQGEEVGQFSHSAVSHGAVRGVEEASVGNHSEQGIRNGLLNHSSSDL